MRNDLKKLGMSVFLLAVVLIFSIMANQRFGQELRENQRASQEQKQAFQGATFPSAVNNGTPPLIDPAYDPLAPMVKESSPEPSPPPAQESGDVEKVYEMPLHEIILVQ